MGALGVLAYNLFFFEALARAPAGKTSLFVSLGPIITAVSVAILLKERLGWRRWAGIALALLGSMTIITDADLLAAGNHIARAFVSGEAFMLLAVISWVGFTIVSRFALLGMSALVATTYSTLFGTVMLLVGATTEIPDWHSAMLSWQNLLLVLYFGLFGTVLAFVWYSEGVQRLGPTRAIVFTNLVPVFGVILGYLLLDEAIEFSMVLGGTMVICGVLMTNQRYAK
jgi:drug/metabolite transporter (DMT)-like permease